MRIEHFVNPVSIVKKRWRGRSGLVSDEDTVDLTAALQARFPQIRFTHYDYWKGQPKHLSDDELQELTVPYRDSLSSASWGYPMLRVWLEPEGWRPEWAPSNYDPIYAIQNQPPLTFTWCASRLGAGSWFNNVDYSCLKLGEVWAHIAEGDKEHITFVNKVWWLIAGLSTNKTPCCVHDLAKEEIRGPFVANQIWIGHKALEWVRQDPARCFVHRHRPADSIEGWRPKDEPERV